MVGACVGQRCVVCRAEKTNRREKLVWATVTPFGGIRTEELTVYPGTRIESRPPEIFVGGYNQYLVACTKCISKVSSRRARLEAHSTSRAIRLDRVSVASASKDMQARSSAASTFGAESEPLLGEPRRTYRARWAVAGGAAVASLALVASASLSGSTDFTGLKWISSFGQDQTDATPAALSGFVGTYDVHSMVRVRNLFPTISQMMSLSWDPSQDAFFLVRFNTDTESVDKKARTIGVAPDIASFLREYYPLRFSEGQPPFQILIHTDDSPGVSCLMSRDCPPGLFEAPVLNLGTGIRDKTIMPNLVDLPMVPLLDCMGVRHFGDVDCPLFTPIDTVAGEAIEARCEANPPCSNYNPMHFRPDLAWDDLEDRLIWRGSNLRMADEIPGGMPLSSSNRAVLDAILALEAESGPEGVTASRLLQKVVDSPTASTQVTPRLKATLMSAAAREAREANAASLSAAAERSTELAASLQSFDLDALFTRKDLEAPDSYELYDALQNHGIVITAPERLDAEELSKFRYHIDLGGAGGTTWSGLFAKLAMPGLLFHHQTVMSDFFVGDELVPWSHFVPVKQDLSDLPEKLDWARAHPVEAQQIARQGSDFMKKLRDDPSVTEALLRKYVRDRTNDVVNQYAHPKGPDGEWISLRGAFYAAGVTPDQLELLPVVETARAREGAL